MELLWWNIKTWDGGFCQTKDRDIAREHGVCKKIEANIGRGLTLQSKEQGSLRCTDGMSCKAVSRFTSTTLLLAVWFLAPGQGCNLEAGQRWEYCQLYQGLRLEIIYRTLAVVIKLKDRNLKFRLKSIYKHTH